MVESSARLKPSPLTSSMRKQQRRFPVTPRISAADHQDTTVRTIQSGLVQEEVWVQEVLVNNRNKDPGLEPGWRSKTRFNQEQSHGSNIQGGLWLDVDPAVAPRPRSGLMKTQVIRY